MKLWDFINAINKGEDILKSQDDKDLALKEYKPFLVNRALSYFPDTIHIANAMNVLNHLDKDQQNAFFINIVRPRKRFSKWVKKIQDQDLNAVMEYYGYSYEKARDVLRILTDDDLDDVKQELEKGGKQ